MFSINPLGTETQPEPVKPTIYNEAYKHSIVDSKYQPETSLLSLVEGTPRLTEYYRVFKNRSEEASPFSPDNVGTYQSYERIKNAIIKQEGNGAFNFNVETTESTKVYNGWCSAALRPGKYDVMIMDIGDGNAGIFTITEQPEPREITANKVYYLTFQFLGILSKEWWGRLNERVVKEFIYSKDAELHSGAYVISPVEFGYNEKLFKWKFTIANYLMRTFYWNPEKTIAFANKTEDMVYDPYLVNFICAVLPGDLRNVYPFINQFSYQYAGLDRGWAGPINLWEILLRGDFNLLSICDNKAAMIPTDRLLNTRTYGNLGSSKFRWFISTNPEDFKKYSGFYNMDGYPMQVPTKDVPFEGYVFSDLFFTGNPTDEFEKIVFTILRDRVCDKAKLLAYCDGYFKLPLKQQLYHGAILLMLLEVGRNLGDPM